MVEHAVMGSNFRSPPSTAASELTVFIVLEAARAERSTGSGRSQSDTVCSQSGTVPPYIGRQTVTGAAGAAAAA